jgi:hypothetical protein
MAWFRYDGWRRWQGTLMEVGPARATSPQCAQGPLRPSGGCHAMSVMQDQSCAVNSTDTTGVLELVHD